MQIFETSCKLGGQGWKFNMQASMLEIYNEEYKDLLAKSSARPSSKASGPGPNLGDTKDKGDTKKHQVVHNADGSTTVSDLTCVDVTSTEKVSDEMTCTFLSNKFFSVSGFCTAGVWANGIDVIHQQRTVRMCRSTLRGFRQSNVELLSVEVF